MYADFNEETPKYLKKKVSSKSNAISKSKHKHTYVACLLKTAKGNYHKSEYCTLCGKIGSTKTFELVRVGSTNYFRQLHNDEVLAKYMHLEIKEVSDTFQKYVGI